MGHKRPHGAIDGAIAGAAAIGRAIKRRRNSGGHSASKRKSTVSRGVKRRKTRSYTKTKTNRKERFKADEDPSGVSSSNAKVFVGKAGKRKPHKRAGHFVYLDNFGFRVQDTHSGVAAVSIMDMSCYYDQLILDVSTGLSPAANLYEPGLFALDPNSKTTGSSALNTVGAGSTVANAIYLRDIYTKYELYNSTNYAQIVDVYHLVYKGNYPATQDPIAIWNTSLQREAAAIYSSAAVIPSGATLTTTAGYGAAYYPTAHPMETTFMRKTFKLVKHKTFHMAGKATVSYNVKTVYNRLIERDQISQWFSVDGMKYFKNLTCVVLIKTRGQPIIDTSNGSVTSAPGDIIWTANRKVKGHFATLTNKVRETVEAPNLYYSNTAANQKAVNIQDVLAPIVEA